MIDAIYDYLKDRFCGSGYTILLVDNFDNHDVIMIRCDHENDDFCELEVNIDGDEIMIVDPDVYGPDDGEDVVGRIKLSDPSSLDYLCDTISSCIDDWLNDLVSCIELGAAPPLEELNDYSS